MSTQLNIFVVIPAFNERSAIATTIADVQSHGYQNCIVVDDGSSDDTYAIASRLCTTLRHATNRGMGAALATGTMYALKHQADIVVHFDADGQHRASDIERFVKILSENKADIVLGSRYIESNSVPFTKKYLLHYPARLLQNMLTHISLTDVHNGFRAMNRYAAQRIQINQDRMAHNSEIVGQIHKLKLRYTEVPVTIVYHRYGQGIFGGMRILKDLIIKKLFL